MSTSSKMTFADSTNIGNPSVPSAQSPTRSGNGGPSFSSATRSSARSTHSRRLEHEESDAEEDESDNEDNFEIDKNELRRAGSMSKGFTDEEERAVIKKLDRRLVLFLGFLYMLSFLDRSSISPGSHRHALD